VNMHAEANSHHPKKRTLSPRARVASSDRNIRRLGVGADMESFGAGCSHD
jgi:hypothetical protein